MRFLEASKRFVHDGNDEKWRFMGSIGLCQTGPSSPSSETEMSLGDLANDSLISARVSHAKRSRGQAAGTKNSHRSSPAKLRSRSLQGLPTGQRRVPHPNGSSTSQHRSSNFSDQDSRPKYDASLPGMSQVSHHDLDEEDRPPTCAKLAVPVAATNHDPFKNICQPAQSASSTSSHDGVGDAGLARGSDQGSSTGGSNVTLAYEEAVNLADVSAHYGERLGIRVLRLAATDGNVVKESWDVLSSTPRQSCEGKLIQGTGGMTTRLVESGNEDAAERTPGQGHLDDQDQGVGAEADIDAEATLDASFDTWMGAHLRGETSFHIERTESIEGPFVSEGATGRAPDARGNSPILFLHTSVLGCCVLVDANS